MSSNAQDRINSDALLLMRREIAQSEGQEVLFVGHLNQTGTVSSVEVYARGSEVAVAAPAEFCERGDIVIHNHPSGVLRPSDADVAVASRLAERGIGSALIDNSVDRIYVLVEPVIPEETVLLDEELLADVISENGAVAVQLPGFRVRPSQVEMLRLVTSAFNRSRIAVAEAGTGVGKSFAYLIPAVSWARVNSERVVIATATINLQQQLVEHDLPLVQRSLGTDIPVALVKGRGNYVCRRRLEEQRAEADLFSDGESVRAIAEWAETSPTGSRSDVPFPVGSDEWSRVNSEPDTCSASRCPNRERCFILKARQRAAGAKILVANHHLVFSDLAVRQAGAGYDSTAILPPFQRLVFDEAHNLERAATSFFSESLSYFSVLKHAGRLLRRRGRHRFGLLDRLPALEADPNQLKQAEAELETLRGQAETLNAALVAFLAGESSWRLTTTSAPALRDALGPALFDMHRALLATAERLGTIARTTDDRLRDDPAFLELVAIIRRFEGMAALLDRFSQATPDEDTVLWMDRRSGGNAPFVALNATPLDISALMQEAVFSPYETIVMTSATLAVNGDFRYWGTRIGVPLDGEDTTAGQFASPFDYAQRVMLAVPSNAPAPDDPLYEGYLKMIIPRLVHAGGGGVLILFTSYRQLQAVYDEVAPLLEGRGYSCYRQGSDDRVRLLEQFRNDVASVLFATDSFWEGVDIPGKALRLVVVCRLPFRVPTDPVQLARAEAVEKSGGNSFVEFSLPQAVMRLKQGFGRLMRRVDDYGAVVVTDPRMIRKIYGRIFWNSLPPAQPMVLPGEPLVEELQQFLLRFRDE
ncbi:MAG: helicase C-terminal domain-containing protein [Alkalispirochaeta sp.]